MPSQWHNPRFYLMVTGVKIAVIELVPYQTRTTDGLQYKLILIPKTKWAQKLKRKTGFVCYI